MKAKVEAIKRRNSKYGGDCLLVVFQSYEDNKRYKTWVVPSFRNFPSWQRVLEGGKGTILDNLRIKKGDIVDSDSNFTIVSVVNDKVRSVIQASLF